MVRQWRARARSGTIGALLALSAAGCTDLFLGPEPDPEDALVSFDLLWSAFDRHYSYFEVNGIDWDALRETYRPRIGPGTSEAELFDAVGEMLDHLRDGHVNVYDGRRTYAYSGWFSGYPVNFDPNLVVARMNGTQIQVSSAVFAGRPEPGIGYIHIGSFPSDLPARLDTALAALAPLNALIVDLRHNTGGSDGAAAAAAGRLADQRRLFRRVAYRNGPEHDDFTEPRESFVEPRGPVRFTGPTAVLTNRRTFSSAESFVLAARQMPHVIVVGDTTGGGSGAPIYRELPNGWIYRMSRWVSYTPDGRTFQGVGLAPDHPVSFDAGESDTDLIIEEAIRLLRDQAF